MPASTLLRVGERDCSSACGRLPANQAPGSAARCRDSNPRVQPADAVGLGEPPSVESDRSRGSGQKGRRKKSGIHGRPSGHGDVSKRPRRRPHVLTTIRE
ncbi:hypothetical protein OPV22_012491 [Ensete ventricosum]|uniref:Uncharacterized protein n=1 Tax=Ensete ventricosum TaxID=4639 RepID=A0AAV8QX92_ENSVE|nr:hypothetical protein OPV22_012491 [Ensete ventricosum]